LVNFFRELNLQYLISRERGSEVMFMRDFFVEDYWHFVDMGSMALAAVTLVLYIRFSYYRPLVPFDDRPPTFDSPRLTLEWLKSFFNAQAWAYYFGMDGLSQYSFTQYHVYNSKIGGENPESGLDPMWTNEAISSGPTKTRSLSCRR